MISRFQQRAEQEITGFQSPADDHLEGRLNIIDKIVVDAPNTHYVWMDSEEMRGFDIRMCDLIVIDKSLKPVPGCIVLAWYQGSYYLRKLGQSGRNIRLISDVKTIEPKDGEEIMLWGVATALCRNLLPQSLRKGKYRYVCAL